MEIFRDLHLTIDPDRMNATADLIERTPPPGWTRDRAAEGRARSAPVLEPKPTFCFVCSEEQARPAAMLVLRQKTEGSFSVSNIVPTSRHQLKYNEYNNILEDFYSRVIRPYTGANGTTATLTDENVDLEHWMSHDSAELLRQFSAAANKGTGSSHPADRDRWNAFVVAAHRGGSEMDAAELHRWLVEVSGWPPEVADQLAIEYEYGRELLGFADDQRRSA